MINLAATNSKKISAYYIIHDIVIQKWMCVKYPNNYGKFELMGYIFKIDYFFMIT